MTDKHWAEEVERAIAGAGLPWRVHASWIENHGSVCYAELTDTRSGKERTIEVSLDVFASVAGRRDEIVRQLRPSPSAASGQVLIRTPRH